MHYMHLFAASALTGILVAYPHMEREDQVDLSFDLANLMVDKSKQLDAEREEMRKNNGF
jgi:hypothetical protein